jgi:hypothetical protein
MKHNIVIGRTKIGLNRWSIIELDENLFKWRNFISHSIGCPTVFNPQ